MKSKQILSILFLSLILMTCGPSKSEFAKLADQFPELGSFPIEFVFESENLVEPIETSILSGIVRPVGRIKVEGAEILVANNFESGEAPWGDVTAFVFVDEQFTDSLVVASDFSLTSWSSILKADMTLETEEVTMDADTGDDLMSKGKFRLVNGKWERL